MKSQRVRHDWATLTHSLTFNSFPGSSVGKESTCNVGDLGSIPGLGRSLGKGKGNPLQYSGLENSMDCTEHEVPKSWTRLNDFHFCFPKQFHILKCTGTQGVWREDSGPILYSLHIYIIILRRNFQMVWIFQEYFIRKTGLWKSK